MVDGLSALVVHEEVVEDGAQLGRQAGQEVDHAQPRHADLGPGDVERQQHQEAQQRDACDTTTQANKVSAAQKAATRPTGGRRRKQEEADSESDL